MAITTLPEASSKPANSRVAPRYVVMTAAYNEEEFLARTIEAVAAQTVLPAKWVIASDGSTDGTDEIVKRYAAKHSFIQLLRVERSHLRGVISKVNALSLAYKELSRLEHEFVGNLDADVSPPENYFEDLMGRFRADPTLGIAGGMICEQRDGEFRGRPTNRVTSVAHAAQLVRRECFEAIGGYKPLKYGGEDWCAEISARMQGWKVQSFPDIQVKHYRITGGADHVLRHCFRQGKMDFSVGSLPAFELVKCARRLRERPLLIGGVARFAGFCCCYLAREPRLVSPEFVTFLRSEQKQRLKSQTRPAQAMSLPAAGDRRPPSAV